MVILVAKRVLIAFASFSDSSFNMMFGCGGHCSGCCSHVGPVHHSSGIWFPYTPLLPMSAGFWLLGTCLQVIYAFALILLIPFIQIADSPLFHLTNVVQLLSVQPWISLMLKLESTDLMFSAKFEAMSGDQHVLICQSRLACYQMLVDMA